MPSRRAIAAGLILATLGLSQIPAVKYRLRVAFRAFLRFGLCLISRPYSSPLGTVALIISPHQDDETLGCGGLIALKRLDGQSVHVAFVTDGSASHHGHPVRSPTEVSALRADEARTSLRLLGVETPAIHFLGAPDGKLARLSPDRFEAVAAQITALLADIRPNEVFLPFRRDGGAEHEAAFALFAHALRSTAYRPRVYEFPIWSWWNPLLLITSIFPLRRIVRFRFDGYEFLKARALAAYKSQTEPMPPWTRPVLPPGFVRSFESSEEFFFEI